MRLTTFNLNGIRARLPRLLEWLEREQPDVVCLQELKCADESLPIGDIEAAGYGAVWHGQKGFNGVAILADGIEPVEAQRTLPGDPEDEHARYIEADVNGVRVACIYLPNGNPVGPEKTGTDTYGTCSPVQIRLNIELPVVFSPSGASPGVPVSTANPELCASAT